MKKKEQRSPRSASGGGSKGLWCSRPTTRRAPSRSPSGGARQCCGGGPEKAKYGNYHIIKLGPIVDGLYDNSVVSNASPASQLYILTRD